MHVIISLRFVSYSVLFLFDTVMIEHVTISGIATSSRTLRHYFCPGTCIAIPPDGSYNDVCAKVAHPRCYEEDWLDREDVFEATIKAGD